MPKVVFARINRRSVERSVEQPTLQPRTFRDEMHVLAAEGALEVIGADQTEWIAADLELDPSGDYLTGILGYVHEEMFRDYAREVKSWKKGEIRTAAGASRRTLSPFAVDVRNDERWLAFVHTQRINPTRFANGLQNLLTGAVTRLGLVPAEWDVDLIPSKDRLFEWLERHPDVGNLHRTLKVPNPGLDLSEEIERMRGIAASRKYERYAPRYGKTLDLERDREVLEKLIEGVDRGDVELTITTRSGPIYRSSDKTDQMIVEDWGEDWDRATEVVLAALRQYVQGRPIQGRLPEEGGTSG